MAATIRNQTESQRIANQRISTTAERQAAQRASVGAAGVVPDDVAVTHERQSKILKKQIKTNQSSSMAKALNAIEFQTGIFDSFIEAQQKQQRVEDAVRMYNEQTSNKDVSTSTFDKISNEYSQMQSSISSRIPTLRNVSNAGARFAKKHPYASGIIYNSANTAAGFAREVVPEEYGRPLAFQSRDYYIKFQEKPLDWGAKLGGQLALAYGLGAGANIATTGSRAGLIAAGSKLGGRGGKVLTSGSKAFEPALGAVGLGGLGFQLYKATPSERIETAPQIGIAMGGGYAGWKAGGSAIGRLQTIGRTEIPLSAITDLNVARGTQNFPMTRRGQTPSQLLAEFKSNKYGLPSDIQSKPGVWHATPGKFKSGIEIMDAPSRSTDMPGLYVSPRVSPYFTRIAPKNKGKYSLFGESEPIRPSIARIYTEGISRLPGGFRSIDGGRLFIRAKGKPGKAYLTPDVEARAITGNVEAEATITPGTILTEIGSKYYTKVGGRRVPIDRFVVGAGKAGKRSTAFDLAAKDYSGYSSLPSGSKGIIKPSYFASAISSSMELFQSPVKTYSGISKVKSRAYPNTNSLISPPSWTKPSGSRSPSKSSVSFVGGSTFITPSSAVRSSKYSPASSGSKSISGSFAFLENPLVVKPKLKQKSPTKKRRSKRSADYYQVTNPIKDIAELMKQ